MRSHVGKCTPPINALFTAQRPAGRPMRTVLYLAYYCTRVSYQRYLRYRARVSRRREICALGQSVQQGTRSRRCSAHYHSALTTDGSCRLGCAHFSVSSLCHCFSRDSSLLPLSGVMSLASLTNVSCVRLVDLCSPLRSSTGPLLT